ncbi:S-layer homology domain-containing protein [Ammoniphilus sp. YIM 78166]|uniref:S-layer homology domain-containing protein n=1 Tax=Ammoniphilus sp. YIM 78166 TaxID=1644106 RepID=UPI001431FAE1|nr:S-layer homology domain-containing protein [Ammoniphilus sp. YIM 78166]
MFSSVASAAVAVSEVRLDAATVPMLYVNGQGSGPSSFALTPQVLPVEADQRVRWSSTNENVAKVTVSTVNGVDLGVVEAVAPGKATIIVSTMDGGKTAFREVEVYGPVTGIQLTPATLTLTAGASPQALTATVQPANATHKGVNWVSTKPEVAQVDQQGNVTPLVAGTTTIIATSTDGGFSKTSEVTVTGVAVSQITLNRSSLTLNTGTATTTLTATVTPANATNRTVTWTSSDPAIVRVVNGVLTPVVAGRATITASVDNGRKTATCEVTVISGSGQAKDLVMKRSSLSQVELSWSGTTGSALVQLKRGNTVEESEWTSSRTISFHALSYDTRYDVYINDRYLDSFRLRDLTGTATIRDFKVQVLSPTSAELTWTGTSGSVRVELMRSDRDSVDDYKSTSNRAVTFTGLSSSSTYNVYIAGVYVDRFTTGQTVRGFTVKSRTDSTAEFTWQGTTGTARVELRNAANQTLFDQSTTSSSIAFTSLQEDTEYRVYINGVFIQTVRTEMKNKPTNFSAAKNLPQRTIELRWSGTTGPVEVVLKKDGVAVHTATSSNQRATFRNVAPNQDYSVYINNRYMEHVSLTLGDIVSHWAKPAINQLLERGIVNGYEDGNFLPERQVNREEFVTMLVNAKGYSLAAGGATFQDVQPGYWANPFVETAVAQGIILSGEYRRSFEPRKPITREEMAIMLARAQKLSPAAGALVRFTDQAQIGNNGLVGAVVQASIINGYPDQTFRPKGVLTRAEAATVIQKIVQP